MKTFWENEFPYIDYENAANVVYLYYDIFSLI